MGRPTQPRRTNRYTLEFKLQAVKLSHMDGVQVRDVAEALDIHPFMLSRWRKEVRDGLIKPSPPAKAKAAAKPKRRTATDKAEIGRLRKQRASTERELRRYAQLKRDHALLEQEHALLKKAIRFTSARKPTRSPSSSRKRTASA